MRQVFKLDPKNVMEYTDRLDFEKLAELLDPKNVETVQILIKYPDPIRMLGDPIHYMASAGVKFRIRGNPVWYGAYETFEPTQPISAGIELAQGILKDMGFK